MASLVIDQHGDLIQLDTGTARRPMAGILYAAGPDESQDSEVDEALLAVDGSEDDQDPRTDQDALDVDLEGGDESDSDATVWGASFAMLGPGPVDLRATGSTACPVSIVGLTKDARPFPARRLRSRRADITIDIALGEGSADFPLALCDAQPDEEDNHVIELRATWRAVPAAEVGPGAMLVHLAVCLAGSRLPADHALHVFAAEITLSSESGMLRPLPSRLPSNPLFAHVPRMATGHNCAVVWNSDSSNDTLTLTAWPTWDESRARKARPLPAVPSREDLEELVAGYGSHVEGLGWRQLPLEVMEQNRRACEQLLAAAQETLNWLTADPDLWQVFEDACRVIMGTPTRDTQGWSLALVGTRSWRPFQILFFLAAAKSTVDERHPCNDRVDVIAFPTGGGKTEAYLLLSAFTLLFLRRQTVVSGDEFDAQTRVLMRYPLRLLAAQQLQRAAAMTGKLSILVGHYKTQGDARYGTKPCYIGLWAGSSLTPNTIKQAKTELHESRRARGGSSSPSTPIGQCPLCQGPVSVGTAPKSERLVLRCEGDVGDQSPCYYRDKGRMWIRWIDEELYKHPSEFLIATQDKIAIAPWRSHEVRALFTRDLRLVIQDELHMLDDELGSLEGTYQPYLERQTGPVKVVASSATTKNTARQVQLLYDRTKTLTIPAPELLDQRWYVSAPDAEAVRTTVTGLMPSSRVKALHARLLLLSAQLQASQQLFRHAEATAEDPEAQHTRSSVDSLWTNLVYFGSRPLLRETAVLLRRDITRQVNSFRFTYNYPGTGRAQWFREHSILEASSESESTVTEIIEALENGLDFSPSDQALAASRVCLATSMIEVGIDVDRLGLMTFVGHPKETNSYIQAGGRIGRQADRPGLTYVLYRPFSLRDRSIYEDFLTYHQQRNDMVEPALLAPYAPGALRRTLPSLATLRFAENHDPSDPLTQETAADLQECLEAVIQELSGRFGQEADLSWLADYQRTLQGLVRAAVEQSAGQLPLTARADLHFRSDPRGLLVPLERKPQLEGRLHWFGPTSLRTVAGEILAGITRPAFEAPVQVAPHVKQPVPEEPEAVDDEEA